MKGAYIGHGVADRGNRRGHYFAMVKEMITDKKERGEFFRHLREEKKVKANDIAKLLGVSRAFVSHVEHGQSSFSTENLLSIAELLKTDPDEILLGAGKIPEDVLAKITSTVCKKLRSGDF